MTTVRIVLATENRHKLDEIRAMLADYPVELLTLADFPDAEIAEETGTTFEENATLKAESVARATGLWSLADDSGLEVDALDGRPGVYSKRYAGPEATAADNNAKLLTELAAVDDDARGARFVSVMALARPDEPTELVRGEVRGSILRETRGTGGFGYDPLFYYPPYERAFGEIDADAKNRVSHRAAALVGLRERIGALLAPTRPAGETAVDTPPDFLRPERRRKDRLGFVDYVEAIILALIMALVLREFFIEAFKIPTPSMAPALRGDPHGDRILVDKWLYRFREPRRWEVAVFRYPLEQTTNFIKRVAGLPGETVRIEDGDLFIDEVIERKPDDVQRGLWIPLFPESRDPYTASPHRAGAEYGAPGHFEVDERRIDGDAWHPTAGGRAHYAFSAMQRPPARYKTSIHHYRDLRFGATMTLAAGAAATVELDTRDRRCTVSFRTDAPGFSIALARHPSLASAGLRATREGQRHVPHAGRSFEPGRAYDVAVWHADYRVVVEVDGERWATLDLERTDGIVRWFDVPPSALALGATGDVTWDDLAVARDLHYAGSDHERIPAGHYYMLGDNSYNSRDSRKWSKTRYKLKDGGFIDCDDEPRKPILFHESIAQGDTYTDVYGRDYPGKAIDFSVTPVSEPAPFVPRDLIVGRAFVIFYPWPPIYSESFRPGVIR